MVENVIAILTENHLILIFFRGGGAILNASRELGKCWVTFHNDYVSRHQVTETYLPSIGSKYFFGLLIYRLNSSQKLIVVLLNFTFYLLNLSYNKYELVYIHVSHLHTQMIYYITYIIIF